MPTEFIKNSRDKCGKNRKSKARVLKCSVTFSAPISPLELITNFISRTEITGKILTPLTKEADSHLQLTR
jgi:hypothetical protein